MAGRAQPPEQGLSSSVPFQCLLVHLSAFVPNFTRPRPSDNLGVHERRGTTRHSSRTGPGVLLVSGYQALQSWPFVDATSLQYGTKPTDYSLAR